MQKPTLQNVHIRSADDAHKVFYAVQLGLLPKIEKRLDAHERQALRPGDVYVWEKKGPTGDAFSVGMERFTEGKSWTASRVREDFLMYFENVKKTKGRGGQRAKASENMIVRPGEHDQFIKQTYSVYRNDPEGDPQADSPDEKPKEPRKWHLNAYFTKLTEGQLQTIDDIPELRNLVVPDGAFRSARTSKAGKKGEPSKPSGSGTKRTFAPFPSNYRAHQQQPSAASYEPQPGPSTAVDPFSPSTSAMAYPQPAWPDASAIAIAPAHTAAPVQPSALYTQPLQMPPQSPTLPSLAQALRPVVLPDAGDAVQSPPPPEVLNVYTPAPISAQLGYSSEPNYEYISASTPVMRATHSEYSLSPSLSDHSSSSWRSVASPMSPSPFSSSSNCSLSPMISSIEFPLLDNGMPYIPAPPVDENGQPIGPMRVDLAPLHSLRTHPYRRSLADDRALRLLGPGAR